MLLLIALFMLGKYLDDRAKFRTEAFLLQRPADRYLRVEEVRRIHLGYTPTATYTYGDDEVAV